MVHRTAGSLAFTAAACTVWGFMRDPDDPDRILFLSIKTNISQRPPGLAYRMTPRDDSVVLSWEQLDDSSLTMDEVALMQESSLQTGSRPAPRLAEAKKFLRTSLSAGAKPANDIKHQAEAAGINKKTLDRAKTALGIKAEKTGYTDGWLWLP